MVGASRRVSGGFFVLCNHSLVDCMSIENILFPKTAKMLILGNRHVVRSGAICQVKY